MDGSFGLRRLSAEHRTAPIRRASWRRAFGHAARFTDAGKEPRDAVRLLHERDELHPPFARRTFENIDGKTCGAVLSGSPWKRPKDQLGAAFVVNGLSGLHERYLAGGGYGFLIGDGKLDYRAEFEGDFYYKGTITDWLELSAIYQPIVDPAYNADRGPVHVVSARARVAF